MHSGHTRMSSNSFEIGMKAPVVNVDFSKSRDVTKGGGFRFGTVAGIPRGCFGKSVEAMDSLGLGKLQKTECASGSDERS